MITLSRRSETINPQPMFRLLARARELEQQGTPVHHLEIGDTAAFVNEPLRHLLAEALDRSRLGYGPAAGESTLRDAVARRYARDKGFPFTRDHVVVAPANALITQVLAVLCDPGDAVLLPDPGFPTYRLAVDYNGLEARYYPLRQSRGWNPDPAEVERLLDSGIRAIVLNSPSNPLGVVLDCDVLDTIVELAARRGIACIVDEAYKHLIYTPGLSAELRHRGNCVYLYSLSKEAAAPGLRIGSLVGPPAIAGKIADFNSMFLSCMPDFIQNAAAAYLEVGGDFHQQICATMPARIEAAARILKRSRSLRFVLPNASFYIYLDISRTGVQADQFCNRLLEERRVAVCPGTCFGPSGKAFVRVSICGEEADLLEGCAILVDFADQLVQTHALMA